MVQRSNGGSVEIVTDGSREMYHDQNATAKRGGGGGIGFRNLSQRKSDAAQPVVLVSMTRRPSNNSPKWKPFKWKSFDDVGGEQRSTPGPGIPSTDHLLELQQQQQQQQTNVDMTEDQPQTSPKGRDNPAYTPEHCRPDV